MQEQILQNNATNLFFLVQTDEIRQDVDDETTITCSIKNPNDVEIITDEEATRYSEGRYYISLDASDVSVLGEYTTTWNYTLDSLVCEVKKTFEVVNYLDNVYISVDEFKNMTSMNLSSKTDSQILNYLKRATNLVESYIGGSVGLKKYKEKTNCVIDNNTDGLHIQLNHTPIEEVIESELKYGVTETSDLDVDNFRINEKAGYLEYFYTTLIDSMAVCSNRTYGKIIKPQTTTTYYAGYIDIPDKVKLATSKLAEQLLNQETKEFVSLKSFSMEENYSETYDDKQSKGTTLAGEIASDEVKELLREYRHPIKRHLMII